MQNSPRNWDSAGIGRVAFSTALAVATAAGVFAVKGLGDGLPTLTTVLATLLATISLLAYLAVVLFGLNALLGEIRQDRENNSSKLLSPFLLNPTQRYWLPAS